MDERAISGRVVLVAAIATVAVLFLSIVRFTLDLTRTLWLDVLVLLATLVVVFMSVSVFRDTASQLFAKQIPVQLPLVIGTTLLFVTGMVLFVKAVAAGVPATTWYFEGVSLALFFHLLTSYMVQKKGVSTYVSPFSQVTLPDTVRKVQGKKEVTIGRADLCVGDIIRIKSGEIVPADGIITVGASKIKEHIFTGDERAVRKTIRDTVYAGTTNTNGMFLMQVTQTANVFGRSLSKRVRAAQNTISPMQRAALRVQNGIVLITFLLALCVFLWWSVFSPNASVLIAITLCATLLFIVSPAILTSCVRAIFRKGIEETSSHGVLFRDAKALQLAASTRLMVFEKDGVLSEEALFVDSIHTYHDLDERVVLRYAASLVSQEATPLAQATLSFAEKKQVSIGEPRVYEAISAIGFKGKVEGRAILIGTVEDFQTHDIGIYDVRERIPQLAKKELSPILVAVEGKIAALLGVRSTTREHASTVISKLHDMHIKTALLTYDRQEPTQVFAKRVGIDIVRFQLNESAMRDELKKMQRKQATSVVTRNKKLASHADVGYVFGCLDTDVPAVLLGNSLLPVPNSLSYARRCVRLSRQGFTTTVVYHVAALVLATGITLPLGMLISPGVAACASALFGAVILTNSMRIEKTQRS